MRRWILLALLPLTACGMFESPAEKALRRSPDYKAGYSDGCASARLDGANARKDGLSRDDQAYGGNRAYGLGWDQGFGACRPASAYSQPGAPGGIFNLPTPGGSATP